MTLERRETVSWDGVAVDVIGRDDLIAAKRAPLAESKTFGMFGS